MSWDPIDDAELNPGYNILKHMRKVWNSLQYLYGTIGTLGTDSVLNGSFEIDGDSDGVPDNWTKTLYPGGSFYLDSSNNVHGTQCIKIVHPGGSGNGGGYAESDYRMISPARLEVVSWIHWCTAASMKNMVQARYYTSAKTYISDETLYSSTVNPTSARMFSSALTIPSDARFVKYRLIGGYTDTDVAGTAYFDAVSDGLKLDIFKDLKPSITFGSQTSGSGGWEDKSSVTFLAHLNNLPLTLSFPASVTGSAGTGVMRFKVGSVYSNEVQAVSSTVTNTFTLVLPSSAAMQITLTMQLKAPDGGGSAAAGEKSSSTSSLLFNGSGF